MSIGGYFELELPVTEEFHRNAIRLNTGRNVFEYILRAKNYKMVYLPFYTCDVMLEPITKLNLKYKFSILTRILIQSLIFKGLVKMMCSYIITILDCVTNKRKK